MTSDMSLPFPLTLFIELSASHVSSWTLCALIDQVRDRVGAMEDIHSHGLAYKRRELAAMMAGESPPRAFGMLMFSCNGRGTNLYDEPSFDSRTLTSYVPVPCCGFMCNGECYL
jgi:small ligand-binding sensory domain FIST